MYLLVGDSRELERVLVQQVASLRGELNAGALDQEGVVVLDEEPVKINDIHSKKRVEVNINCLVCPCVLLKCRQANIFLSWNTQVRLVFFLTR